MKRRTFLTAAAALPMAGLLKFATPQAQAEAESVSTPAAEAGEKRRVFEITTHLTLPNGPGGAQVWLPLAQSAGDYQTARDPQWQGNAQAERVHDSRYGAPMLRATWDGPETRARELKVVQTVATRGDRRASPLLPLTEAERKFWTAPTPSTPLNEIMLATAARLTAGKAVPRVRLRAIYDWVVDHTYRDPDTPGCGTGFFKPALENGRLGGKCADINTLLVALARAAGFPAREVYGIRVAASERYPSLGKAGEITKAQHCRAEVFLDDEGWFPVDPADVRKVVLEQKVALDSPEGRTLRDGMFGRWEMNWVGYNSATDLELPGAGGRKPDFCFLMYPCGFTAQGPLPCLDPARFHYEIHASEVTA